MTDVVLRTEDLKKNFGQLEVLKGITTEIRRGEVVSIIGPSGGGKSTFLRCLNRLEMPDGGKVFFKDQDITDAKLDILLFNGDFDDAMTKEIFRAWQAKNFGKTNYGRSVE